MTIRKTTSHSPTRGLIGGNPQEFADQYEKYSAMENKAHRIDAEARHRQKRPKVLRDACSGFDPDLTIFGIEALETRSE